MTKHSRKLKIAGIAAVIIAASLLVLFVIGAMPAMMVGNKFISVNHVRKNTEIARKLEPNIASDEATDQLIKVYKQFQLLSSLKVKVNYQTVEDELNYLIVDNGQAYQQLLDSYFGGDEDMFKEMVVLPQVYNRLLAVKYNSDFGKNKSAYDKSQNILAQLGQGKSFDELAKSESADSVSGSLGGDLGFLMKNQILPELWPAVQNSPVGEVKKQVVVSRLGYHILYPVETADQNGEKTWHIKHILIETQGFESWLNQELEKIRVWRILGS